jgi:hypothetical protein
MQRQMDIPVVARSVSHIFGNEAATSPTKSNVFLEYVLDMFYLENWF